MLMIWCLLEVVKGCKSVATPLVANEKLEKEDASDEVDASNFRSIVESLMDLTATRPNIIYATSLLSNKPTQIHLGTAKRIMRYIQGSLDFDIVYERKVEPKLFGFCDIDWGGSMDDMKGTSGYAYPLGSGVFSWASN